MSLERTEQQAAAVERRDRDIFLRAGAGTGKTSVLVDRFCAAALDPDGGVERILAFTFTERAADQLRRRIRDELSARIREAEGERLEALRTALDATDRAWISTIHGFCRRLLASHPAAAGIDPRFRVVDEAEAERLAIRAFDSALAEMVESGEPEALELAAANRRRTLLEMTRGAYDELRSHGDPNPALPRARAAGHPRGDRRADRGRPGSPRGVRGGERQVGERAASGSPRPWSSTRTSLPTTSFSSPSATWRSARMRRRSRARRASATRESLKRAQAAVAAHVLGPAYEQLRELVARFGARYEQLKEERAALDFEDLQLKAVELLSGSDPLRDRYREQFDHLMVDEFQDTNGLQLRLIEQLRGPATRLFLVGDEFQSIYGFRHADVEVYRREHRRFAEGDEPNGEALPLTGNFRAAPELVAATNAIGRGLLDGFEPLTAFVEEEASGRAVELLLTVDDRKGWEAEETGLPRLPDDPSSGSKVAEARRLAGRLRRAGRRGRVDPAEIVVLMRAFTHVAAVERALKDAGLDPYVVGRPRLLVSAADR